MFKLIKAIKQYDTTKALKIIESGHYDPDKLSKYGDCTALMHACIFKLSDVALALIATGKSKPKHVDSNNFTALMYACRRNMTDVAIALIATGKSNHEHADKSGYTALTYARLYNMTAVIDALENYDNYMASLQQPTQTNPYDDPNYVMSIDI